MVPDLMTQTPLLERTVESVVRRHAETRPDNVAMIESGGATCTYGELRRRSLHAAATFAELGLARQDAVLTMLDNHADRVFTWIGLGTGAFVDVPINTAYKGEMLRYIIEHSGARCLVIEAHYLERLLPVADGLHRLETLVVRGEPKVDLPSLDVSWHSLAELVRDDLPAPDAVPAPPHVWDLSAIMYTSGTTGASKGVECPHGHAFASSVAYPIAEPDDVVLVTLPLLHIGALWGAVYNAFIAGATVVVTPNFSAGDFWSTVRRYGATSTLLLGAMADFLFRQPATAEDGQNSLRSVGIVPVPSHVHEFCTRFDVVAEGGYGLTEAGTICVTGPGNAEPRHCGQPRSFFEARIVDENDLEVPSGTVGELVVRTDEPWSMMRGYHGMPEETQRAWRNLWLHTGDAVVREDGVYKFVDRQKDAVRRRGENISSVEVENLIMARDDVAEVAIVAVPSDHTEDELKAFIALTAGSDLTYEELVPELAERMPYFMVPRYYEFVAELPKTPTFKVKKAELRAAGVTATTWDCVAAGFKITRAGLVRVPETTP